MLIAFDTKKLVHPPEDISEFVDRLIERLTQEGLYHAGPDRRSEKRHAVAIKVRAMPLGENLKPIGDPFICTTRDISRRGIALVHFEDVDCPLLAVELTDVDNQSFQAAVEVLRHRPIGPYFEIAGRFVTKVYDPMVRNGAGAAL
jgi:hypothetical protein